MRQREIRKEKERREVAEERKRKMKNCKKIRRCRHTLEQIRFPLLSSSFCCSCSYSAHTVLFSLTHSHAQTRGTHAHACLSLSLFSLSPVEPFAKSVMNYVRACLAAPEIHAYTHTQASTQAGTHTFAYTHAHAHLLTEQAARFKGKKKESEKRERRIFLRFRCEQQQQRQHTVRPPI